MKRREFLGTIGGLVAAVSCVATPKKKFNGPISTAMPVDKIPCAICSADATGSMCFTGWGPFESICRPCYEKRERERNNAVHTEKT